MLAGIFDTFTGLPTHILVVHAVVVLVPLCFLGVCIAAVSQRWRQRLAVPILVLLAVGFVASLVAARSGHALRARLGATPTINHHAHLGVWVAWIVLLALVATTVWFVVEDRMGNISLRSEPLGTSPANAPSATVRLVTCVVAVACCAFATGWIVWTGDAGSRSHWAPIVKATNHK